MLHVQPASIVAVKTSQDTYLATVRFMECGHRKGCRPVQQPVEYIYPQCVHHPEMIK